jgi:hypothetical protein
MVAIVAVAFAILLGCVIQGGQKNWTCSDGTAPESCSFSKPLICAANGSLVEDSARCGCPDGYKASGISCERLKTCSDGTVENSCSKSKPLYCMDGILVANVTACGCPDNYHEEGGKCAENRKCPDGTYEDRCSPAKPLLCMNGTFAERASICGCPDNFSIKGEKCDRIIMCSDGTISGSCTAGKPTYCLNGTFVSRSSICGCPEEHVEQGEGCVSIYELNAKEGDFEYVLRGNEKTITMPVYQSLKDYLASISRYYYCTPDCPTALELEMKYIDEPKERDKLLVLADSIRKRSGNSDEQARMAISLVQNIPFDNAKLNNTGATGRYPYEVLYDDMGVCGEKSHLLAFLLREMGYGVALLKYDSQNHMAIGIKCSDRYDYLGTGYCFIETTVPAIMTYSEGDYAGVVGELSNPTVLKVSDGAEFNAAEEYADAQQWKTINDAADASGGRVSDDMYNEWVMLVDKYGIHVEK